MATMNDGRLTRAIEKFEVEIVAAKDEDAVAAAVNALTEVTVTTCDAAKKDPIVRASAAMVSAALALANATALAKTLKAAGVANP